MDTNMVPPPHAVPIAVRPAHNEPPTARALWPTFMRRTLEEEAVRAANLTPRPTAPSG